MNRESSVKEIDFKESLYKREVKSYVLRSRMTPNQQINFDRLGPIFGVPFTKAPINLEELFKRQAPTVLEIGFGMGTSLLQNALTNPETNFLGIEVHKPGVGALLGLIEEYQIANIRVICADAIQVIAHSIPSGALVGVQLFFPDPWPKRRHHKRRIVQSSFAHLIYEKLAPGGYFHLATDVMDYADHMKSVLSDHAGFTILDTEETLLYRSKRQMTKFEQRGKKLGHLIVDLVFIKK